MHFPMIARKIAHYNTNSKWKYGVNAKRLHYSQSSLCTGRKRKQQKNRFLVSFPFVDSVLKTEGSCVNVYEALRTEIFHYSTGISVCKHKYENWIITKGMPSNEISVVSQLWMMLQRGGMFFIMFILFVFISVLSIWHNACIGVLQCAFAGNRINVCLIHKYTCIPWIFIQSAAIKYGHSLRSTIIDSKLVQRRTSSLPSWFDGDVITFENVWKSTINQKKIFIQSKQHQNHHRFHQCEFSLWNSCDWIFVVERIKPTTT